jgi:hypothetical protein
MGTYLKIAPQNSSVEFTQVDTSATNTTNLSASFASFVTASGDFFAGGTFSGSFIGNITSSSFSGITPFFITASKGYLSYLNTSTLTVVNTGSIDNIFLIQDATGSAFTINNQGVTITKTFTGTAPTPVQGGIYFTSADMYIGTTP